MAATSDWQTDIHGATEFLTESLLFLCGRSIVEPQVIEGQIPPFKVRATRQKGSSWLQFVVAAGRCRQDDRTTGRGKWTRQAKGKWALTLDGKLIYRRGAITLQDAIEQWDGAIKRRIP